MSEEFCRDWEERIRLDQDGHHPNTIPFCKIDRQHTIGASNSAESTVLSSITGPRPRSRPWSWRDRVASTNSYLGLATHPEGWWRPGGGHVTVRHLARLAVAERHVGLARPLGAGTTLGEPAAVLCSTGYQSNLAAISALCELGHDHPRRAEPLRSCSTPPGCPGPTFTFVPAQRHGPRVPRRTEGRRRIIVVIAVFSTEASPTWPPSLPTGTAAGSMWTVPCAGRARPRQRSRVAAPGRG